MLGSSSSISYIVLCNYHSNTSCNHKNTNHKEEPEEPLCVVTKVATVIVRRRDYVCRLVSYDTYSRDYDYPSSG